MPHFFGIDHLQRGDRLRASPALAGISRSYRASHPARALPAPWAPRPDGPEYRRPYLRQRATCPHGRALRRNGCQAFQTIAHQVEMLGFLIRRLHPVIIKAQAACHISGNRAIISQCRSTAFSSICAMACRDGGAPLRAAGAAARHIARVQQFGLRGRAGLSGGMALPDGQGAPALRAANHCGRMPGATGRSFRARLPCSAPQRPSRASFGS
jgi:hypothetical protein